jgi:hypothetical protein
MGKFSLSPDFSNCHMCSSGSTTPRNKTNM